MMSFLQNDGSKWVQIAKLHLFENASFGSIFHKRDFVKLRRNWGEKKTVVVNARKRRALEEEWWRRRENSS